MWYFCIICYRGIFKTLSYNYDEAFRRNLFYKRLHYRCLFIYLFIYWIDYLKTNKNILVLWLFKIDQLKCLKLANHLILTIPSNLTLVTFLQQKKKPFNQTCAVGCQDSTTAARQQKAQKSNENVRKKWIKVNTSSKNIQKPP